MKLHFLLVWAALAFAGGLSAAPPAQAGAPAMPTVGSSLSPAPSRLAATGLAQPIGSQIQLSWVPIPRALGYKVYRDGQLLASSSRAYWIDYAVAAGETHTYTVTGLALTGESNQSTPAIATVPAGGGQVVYADALQNGWQSWGWAGLNLACTGTARSGSAISVSAGPWQGLYLHHAPFSTAHWGAVTFWIHGGSVGGQQLWVKALRNGQPQLPISLGPLVAGQWQSVTVYLQDLGVAGVSDMDGLWVQNATGAALAPFYLDEIALTPATLSPPAAPAGLTATPEWAASCPKCGGMAMPHIVLAWNAVPGASSYTVFRDGADVQAGLAAPGWTDMAVVSGRTYTYTVKATGPGGESLPSAPVSATAPQPPAGQAALTAPVNLGAQAIWQAGPTDSLSWTPVRGAVSYNLYQDDLLIATGLTAPAYTVPTALWCWELNYTVTAVDAMGMESLPSAPATALGHYDPAQPPSWLVDAPQTPSLLVATPEWNAGAPRIHLSWRGGDNVYTYSIYRDGHKVAANLWGLNFFDTSVQPGETHSYAVSSVNLPWNDPVETAPCASVTATALRAAPAPLAAPVQVTDIQPNDDSVVVSFAPVPGAADYRVYDAAHPDSVKYSGGGLSIEMNGLDPVAGADLVVEAVDKLGPFQKMDGMAGPGAMEMDGMHVAINGQGDPSDVPNMLATSGRFHVACRPFALSGAQAFYDTFRGSQPFVTSASIDPAVVNYQPDPTQPSYKPNFGDVQQVENDKWVIRKYHADAVNTQQFIMSNHFMDTLYDGCTPHSGGPIHNNNASLVMMPKATADITGGKVLHVTFEVDAHFDSRRWCDVFVGAANDPLFKPVPSKLQPGEYPTQSGNLFAWEITAGYHQPQIILQGLTTPLYDYSSGMSQYRQVNWSTPAPLNNGTAQDLDKRHRFDLYLSQTHFRLLENGQVANDRDFPAGHGLPFTHAQVYFVHEVYHTGNDRDELVTWDPADSYWPNYRPWGDERHWDNMGFEVLSAFP